MVTAASVSVVGVASSYERRIRAAIERFPSWLVKAARLSTITQDGSAEMRERIASYRHSDRSLSVYPNIGDQLLVKAVGHELMHAVDDNFDHMHFFTSMSEWTQLHRDQGYFDIPKYRDEPLEYFADMAVKYFLLGREKLRVTHPGECNFLEGIVWPKLQDEFGGQ